ncbi:MAG: porin, partial [Planctomycetota bacterium]
LLHVGVSASWRWDIETYRASSTPESWLGPDIVHTAEFPADSSVVLAGEFFYQRDRLSFTAEGGWTRVNVPGGDSIDYWGCYGQVSYFLTPGHITYNRTLGCYGRVRPKRAIFSPGKAGLGDLEVAGRWSILDLDNGLFPGGRAWNVTVALNWYARDNIRVQFNYIFSHVVDAYGVPGANGTMNTLLVRLAYDL